jgi:hypothetical protein
MRDDQQRDHGSRCRSVVPIATVSKVKGRAGQRRGRSEHHVFGELFQEHKDLIADDMTMRIVGVPDDALGIRSSVVEMYFAAVLRTPFNDFSPS